MARQRVSQNDHGDRRPAVTPEARELELAGLAYDLAEEQIKNGTASSQVITHFLKVGSTRELIEQERLRADIRVTEAKVEAMAKADRVEELFEEAIKAMRSYTSSGTTERAFEPGQD